jgi:AcrR family transcriptional regulator
MSDAVNRPMQPDLRVAQIARTEERILRAAQRLFVSNGYAGTTLTAVAQTAGVAPRTVYVRFGTKAALLLRVIDVAIAGDTAPVDVAGREWTARTLTAPSAAERIRASARGGRDIMERAGAMFAVARQAEAVEPSVAAAAQAGREATLAAYELFWDAMQRDGLLPRIADVRQVAATTFLLAAADTFLLMTQTLGWDLDTYESWLVTMWTQLSGT